MAKLNILGGSGEGRSLNVNASRSINLYPDLDSDPESKAIISLTKTPGCALWSSVGIGPNRGQHPFNGVNFVVSGNELHAISTAGVVSASLGTLATADGRVSMSDNGLLASGVGGNQLIIVDGTAGYIYNVVTETFSTISTSGGFPDTPTHVEYIDGYFIVVDGTMSAWASDIYDGLTWRAIATTPVQGAPDNVQVPVSIYQQLFFIKQYTSEFFYDAAVPTSLGFPFARVPGSVLPYGTSAPWSVCRGAGSIFWLADGWNSTGTGGEFVGPVMLNGTMPTLIGTPAITYRMGLWQDRANVFSYCYSERGHTFAVFTSPGDDQTFVYDTTTQMWHERSTYTDSPNAIGRHAGNSYAFFAGKHLLGDYQSGNIFSMSSEHLTDLGSPIVWLRRTNNLIDGTDLDNLFINQLQLDLECSVPANTGAATCALSGDAVSTIAVTDRGYDYTITPQVLLISADGNGSGATATATLNLGSIQSIAVTAGGSGYTAPPQVVFATPPVTPTIGLSYSKDSGHTWGNEQVKSTLRRVMFNRQGYARDRVMQLRGSGPCKLVLLGGYAEVEK